MAVDVGENLKQARHLLVDQNGAYRPKTRSAMNEIKTLLDEAGGNLQDGDQRREHENLSEIFNFLNERSWNASGASIGWGIGLAVLLFLGAKVDPDAAGPAVGVGIYLIIGAIIYGVSCFYPRYLFKGETVGDLDPYAGEDQEKITKTDLLIASRRAAGKSTDVADGMEIGKLISRALIGLATAFFLPVIGLVNFIRFWR